MITVFCLVSSGLYIFATQRSSLQISLLGNMSSCFRRNNYSLSPVLILVILYSLFSQPHFSIFGTDRICVFRCAQSIVSLFLLLLLLLFTSRRLRSDLVRAEKEPSGYGFPDAAKLIRLVALNRQP